MGFAMRARKTLSSASVEKMVSELPIFRRHLEAGYSIGMAARLTGWSTDARMELRKHSEEMDELCEEYQQRKVRGVKV